MTKYTIGTYIGTIDARRVNNIVTVKTVEGRGIYDLESVYDENRFSEIVWDMSDAQDEVTHDDLDDAMTEFDDLEADTTLTDYTVYRLDKIINDKEFETLDIKTGNEALFEELRDDLIAEEKQEWNEYLTNLFGADRIATQEEIMELARFDGMTWNEIVEDINSDDCAYFIASENYNFYTLDGEWIAGQYHKIYDDETNQRIDNRPSGKFFEF